MAGVFEPAGRVERVGGGHVGSRGEACQRADRASGGDRSRSSRKSRSSWRKAVRGFLPTPGCRCSGSSTSARGRRVDAGQSSLDMVRMRGHGILADDEDQNGHATLGKNPVFQRIGGRSPDDPDLASRSNRSRFENSVDRNREPRTRLRADRLSDHRPMANRFRLRPHAAAPNLRVRLRRAIARPPDDISQGIEGGAAALTATTRSAGHGHAEPGRSEVSGPTHSQTTWQASSRRGIRAVGRRRATDQPSQPLADARCDQAR